MEQFSFEIIGLCLTTIVIGLAMFFYSFIAKENTCPNCGKEILDPSNASKANHNTSEYCNCKEKNNS